jgi:hypothetical protein
MKNQARLRKCGRLLLRSALWKNRSVAFLWTCSTHTRESCTSIEKYLGLTPGMLGLCSGAMLTTSWQTALIDSLFHFYRPRIQGDIQPCAMIRDLFLPLPTDLSCCLEWKVHKCVAKCSAIWEMVFTRGWCK